MDHKEAIMEAAIALINEKEDHLEAVTMREISKRAGVGLGLINYHFENKEKLIEACVERMVDQIVERFRSIAGQTKEGTPFERLDELGNMTLTFLFEHQAVARISMLSDLRAPKQTDNTQRTIQAYLPLVAQCRPDWEEERVRQAAFLLISSMQLAFLRHETLRDTQGVDLKDPQERKAYHTKMLGLLLGPDGEEMRR